MLAKKGVKIINNTINDKENFDLRTPLFSHIINDTINDKENIGSYSLLNDLQSLLKLFPLNFEMSTNSGKYKFNKNLIEILIPDIEKAFSKNEDLEEHHFDINYEQNVMQKIDKLFKGESVEFVNS